MQALCVSLTLLLLGVASASNVVVFDSTSASYLQPGSQPAKLEQTQLSSLIAALTGLLPASRIGDDVSAILGAVVKPSALKKPSAYVVLNAGGLTSDSVGEIFKGKQERVVDVQGNKCLVSSTIDALTHITAANSDISLRVLDQHGLQDCDSSCLQTHLEATMGACKSQYKAAEQSMQGKLTLPNNAVLDLAAGEDRMFAVEIASVSAGLKTQLEVLSKRSELKQAQDDVELYEVNIMALHALSQKYGAESQEFQGARAAVAELLMWAVQSLDAAYHGDVVYQVTYTARAPAVGVKAISSWKDQTRRQLLQSWAQPDEAAAAKKFSAKAAGYGAFILLLYFSLAAMHCMCNMPFKTDTLLFPGQKKDQ